jgi:hypothetical protein
MCSNEFAPRPLDLLTFTTLPKMAIVGNVLGALVLIARARVVFELVSQNCSRREYEFL